ncbi:MAG: cysteine-rich CWC family protein [Vicinamibacteria bacterium]
MSTHPLDPSICPLCDLPNACGMAAGSTSCWCSEVTIAPSALQSLPEEAKDRFCVCRRCGVADSPTDASS